MPGEAPTRKDRVAADSIGLGRNTPPYLDQNAKARMEEGQVGPLFGYQNEPLERDRIIEKREIIREPAPAVAKPIMKQEKRIPPAPPAPDQGELQSPRFSGEHIGTDTSTPPRVRPALRPTIHNFYNDWIVWPMRRVQTWARAHPYATLGIFLSLLLLPLISALIARGAMGSTPFFGRFNMFGRSRHHVEAPGDVHVKVHDHRKAHVVEEHHRGRHHHEEVEKSSGISDLGLKAKEAAAGLLGKAKGSLETAKDAIDTAKDLGSTSVGRVTHQAEKAWKGIKDTVDTATDKVADVGDVSQNLWERTKDAAGNVVDRIMHPAGHHEEVTHQKKDVVETHKKGAKHGKDVEVDVHVHDKHKTGATTSTSGLGFFANLMSFFRNPFGSLFSFFRGFISSPFKSLAGLFGLSAGLSSMGLLTLLALTLVPLYLFWMRRRVAAPAARPQIVPVVRPVGYTVMSGAPAQGTIASGQGTFAGQQNLGQAQQLRA